MGEDKRFPKARKVMKTDTGTCVRQSLIMGYGVPSVPSVTVLTNVLTAGWASSWTIPLGCRAFRISKRGLDDSFKISVDAAGATYVTVNGSATYELGDMFGAEDPQILYFQCNTGADDIEILYWTDGQDCNT